MEKTVFLVIQGPVRLGVFLRRLLGVPGPGCMRWYKGVERRKQI